LAARVLTAWLFTVLVASGLWIGTSLPIAAVWIVVVAIAALAARSHFTLDLPPGPLEIRRSDVAAAVFATLPALVYLVATWQQEFPYNGDHAHHHGYALEAFAFWWPWRWFIAAAAIAWTIRRSRPRAALIAIALLPLIGALWSRPYSFAASYPGLLHFFDAPLHAWRSIYPLDLARAFNLLAIPAWLLVLRPLILRRHATPGTFAVAALLFWQKDVAYYFASIYLEPWAIVLMLTAFEHLARFDDQALWRPLLLIGTAALVKEQMIIALPVIAVVYFPRRERVRHIVVTLTALAPFALFFFLRAGFKGWGGVDPDAGAWMTAEHFAAYGRRVSVQFGAALPIAIAGVAALILLARRRAFAALLLVALADFTFFFTASVQQPWVGYPRTNLVPLICAAIAFGAFVERLPPRHAPVAAALVLACNAIALGPFMRAGFGRDVERNFFEHRDAPVFYPIREALTSAERAGLIRAGDEVRLLNNGKHVFPTFYTGPIEEHYADLARRYRLQVWSFRGDPSRCACSSDDAAQLALFVAFYNLGVDLPHRPAIEREAEQCRRMIAATCARTIAIDQAFIGRGKR
jgi:hypothetical protein